MHPLKKLADNVRDFRSQLSKENRQRKKEEQEHARLWAQAKDIAWEETQTYYLKTFKELSGSRFDTELAECNKYIHGINNALEHTQTYEQGKSAFAKTESILRDFRKTGKIDARQEKLIHGSLNCYKESVQHTMQKGKMHKDSASSHQDRIHRGGSGHGHGH